MSYHNRDAQIKHIHEANKIIRKAKSKPSFVKFRKICDYRNLKILSYTDASHLTVEEKTKGVSGKFIFLSDPEERLESKTIV